jgi:hypothetical protein
MLTNSLGIMTIVIVFCSAPTSVIILHASHFQSGRVLHEPIHWMSSIRRAASVGRRVPRKRRTYHETRKPAARSLLASCPFSVACFDRVIANEEIARELHP